MNLVNTSLSITAHDQYGAVVTDYNGPECLSITGAANAPNGRAPSYTNDGTCTGGNIVDFAHGVGTAHLTDFDAQSTTLEVSDIATRVAGSTSFSVAPGALHSLVVSPQTLTPVAGVPFTTVLTALDEYGNLDTNYSGRQCITFSGPSPSPNDTSPLYPPERIPAAPDHRSPSPRATPSGPMLQRSTYLPLRGVLNAQDVSTSVSGFAGLSVAPAGPKAFLLGASPTQVAGSSFPVSLTTMDQYGNVDTNYAGSRCITFSGASNAPDGNEPSYRMDDSCTSGTQVTFANGVANGADVVPVALVDAQTLSLVATDPSNDATGSLTLTVGPGSLDSFTLVLSNASPVVGAAINVGLTTLDQYQNVDTNYSGSQCTAFSGASNAPDGTGPSYPLAGSCASGSSQVTFTAGTATAGAAPSLTLYDSQLVDLIATDVPSQHFGSASINVTPGSLNSLVVIPDSTTQTAGTAFNVRLSALDPYQNVDTNFSGAQCVTFSGPDDAPNSALPNYPANASCATGSSAVTFVNGYVDGPNVLAVTLFDAETTELVATLTPGAQSGSREITVNSSPAIAGIGISGITEDTTPPLM